MSPIPRHAFVTLVATDGYASGAQVLAHALRDHETTKELVCLVTPTVSKDIIDQLRQVFDHVIEVESLDSKAYDNLLLLGRLELGVTLTKIGLWKQTQFDKVVFLDADTLPLRNIDELFERPELSAAPDAGWPDCFNSGVFVAEPNKDTYDELLKMLKESGSFDGGDQGLLNTYFSKWSSSDSSHRLPFIYNTTPTAAYSYLPAYTVYQSNIAVVHFIGADKPWHWTRFSDGSIYPKDNNTSTGSKNLVQKWWDVWEKYYGNASPLRTSKYDVGPTGTRPQADEFSVARYTSIWSDPNDSFIPITDQPAAPMPPLSDRDIGSAWSAPHDISVWIDAPPAIEYHPPPTPPRKKVHFEEPETFEYTFINWDPAFEPPPATNPYIMDMPDFGGYTNAWDRPFSRDEVFTPQLPHNNQSEITDSAPPVIENLAPPPKYDPGMSPQDVVQQIFPWEQDNNIPTRVWLDEDAVRKAKEASDAAVATAAAAAAAAAEAATAAAVADQGRRDSGYNEPRDEHRFTNAWDNVPAIHRYLSRFRDDERVENKKAETTMRIKDLPTLQNFPAVTYNYGNSSEEQDLDMYPDDEALAGPQDVSGRRFVTIPKTPTLSDDYVLDQYQFSPQSQQNTWYPKGSIDYWVENKNDMVPMPDSTRNKSQMFVRNKSQMFAGGDEHPDTGITPYTSAATTPTKERATSFQAVSPPLQQFSSPALDLDIYLKREQLILQEEVILFPNVKPSSRRNTVFEVTPSVTPRDSPNNTPGSHRRHHFRASSGRAEWNPFEALEDVRKASINFGGLEGSMDLNDEDEENRLPAFSKEDSYEDLGILGLRFDRRESDDFEDENIVVDDKLSLSVDLVERIKISDEPKENEVSLSVDLVERIQINAESKENEEMSLSADLIERIQISDESKENDEEESKDSLDYHNVTEIVLEEEEDIEVDLVEEDYGYHDVTEIDLEEEDDDPLDNLNGTKIELKEEDDSFDDRNVLETDLEEYDPSGYHNVTEIDLEEEDNPLDNRNSTEIELKEEDDSFDNRNDTKIDLKEEYDPSGYHNVTEIDLEEEDDPLDNRNATKTELEEDDPLSNRNITEIDIEEN